MNTTSLEAHHVDKPAEAHINQGALEHASDLNNPASAQGRADLLAQARSGYTRGSTDLIIDDSHPKGGVGAVVKDLASGAWHEITHNPVGLLKDAAIGAAAGAAAVIAGPEIALGVGIGMAVGAVEKNGGFVKTAKDLWHGAENLGHSTATVYNPEGHSAAEVNAAHDSLKEAGAVTTDMAAGVLGGVAGGWGASALKSALTTRAATSEVTALTNSGKWSELTNGKVTLNGDDLASSTHADVTGGTLTRPDGTTTKVFFHANEATPEATAARLTNENAGYSLNRMIGFDNAYPESQAVSINVGGQAQEGWLQASAGRPLEDELRERAMSTFGTTQNMNTDVAKLLAEDPGLHAQVEQATVERMVYGDADIAARNLGYSGDGNISAVRNFDMGHAFGEHTIPTLSSNQNSLTTIGLQNAMSGQELSPAMRTTLSNFLKTYDNPYGTEALQEATSLSDTQLNGVLSRVKWLVENGRMPEVDPAVNSPENISWYRLTDK